MFPASIDPSAAPAPTTVWSSSMKVMTSPSASVISLSTAFSRSSNSPRYFAPATIEPRSRLISRLCFRLSGTSPSTIRRARPSTIAVLPTPGSPMSTGLFLVRRDSTWMTRRISSSRPMTGSIFPARAVLGEVAAVLLERLVLLLRVLRGDAVAAAHLLHRGEQLLALDAEPVDQRQEEVLGRQVLVVELGPLRVGRVHDLLELAGQAGLAAVGLRAACRWRRRPRCARPAARARRAAGSGGRCPPPGAAARRAGGPA